MYIKTRTSYGPSRAVIVWWLDLQLHVSKDENKLGAVEGCDRMVVGFTTTCILRREQVWEQM